MDRNATAITFSWLDQTLSLFADRGLFWHEQRTLVVTDTHFGKGAFFRTKGVPVPRGVTEGDLARLDTMLASTAARRLVILGDFLHAKGGRAPRTLRAIRLWRTRHAALDILLIRGNHDRKAGDPPASWNIRCVDNGFSDPPFVFSHEPSLYKEGYALAGHLHPAVRLCDQDGTSLRAPCFTFGPQMALLPAFGSFTGCFTIRPGPKDRVFLTGPDIVEV